MVKISGGDYLHLALVMKAKIGSEVLLCDGSGYDYRTRITYVNKKDMLLAVCDKFPTLSEPKLKVTLYQGSPKAGKFDLIIQKCVELGVYSIVPVRTAYSIGKPDYKSTKLERFNNISKSAAEQCGRGQVPEIFHEMSFKEAVLTMTSEIDNTCYFANEYEERVSLSNIAAVDTASISIFIGPEGGFSKEEVNYMINNGVLSVSLGRRILRTETAGFMALTIFLYKNAEYDL